MTQPVVQVVSINVSDNPLPVYRKNHHDTWDLSQYRVIVTDVPPLGA